MRAEPQLNLLISRVRACESRIRDIQSIPCFWRGVRVVEGARLESVCRGNLTEGSNPSLSASTFNHNNLAE